MSGIRRLLTQLWRILNDLCLHCGGELDIWDEKKATCIRCGKKE